MEQDLGMRMKMTVEEFYKEEFYKEEEEEKS